MGDTEVPRPRENMEQRNVIALLNPAFPLVSIIHHHVGQHWGEILATGCIVGMASIRLKDNIWLCPLISSLVLRICIKSPPIPSTPRGKSESQARNDFPRATESVVSSEIINSFVTPSRVSSSWIRDPLFQQCLD